MFIADLASQPQTLHYSSEERAKAEIALKREELVKKRDVAHQVFIEAVRAKQDTMQAYFEVNQAFQALLAFDARNN